MKKILDFKAITCLIVLLLLYLFYKYCLFSLNFIISIHSFSINSTNAFSILVALYVLLLYKRYRNSSFVEFYWMFFGFFLLFIFCICFFILGMLLLEEQAYKDFIFNFTYFKCQILFTPQLKESFFLWYLQTYLDSQNYMPSEIQKIIYQNIQNMVNQGSFDSWFKQSNTTLATIQKEIPNYIEEQWNLLKETLKIHDDTPIFFKYLKYFLYTCALSALIVPITYKIGYMLVIYSITIPQMIYTSIQFTLKGYMVDYLIKNALSRANFTMHSLQRKEEIYHMIYDCIMSLPVYLADLQSFFYSRLIDWNQPSTPLLHSTYEIPLDMYSLQVFCILLCFVFLYYIFLFSFFFIQILWQNYNTKRKDGSS